MSDALEVARYHRDNAQSETIRGYWQEVMDRIERRRKEQK